MLLDEELCLLDEDFCLLDEEFFFDLESVTEELKISSSSSGTLFGDLSSPQQAKNRDKSRAGMIVFFIM